MGIRMGLFAAGVSISITNSISDLI